MTIPAKEQLVHLTVHRADGNRSPHRARRALGFIDYSTVAKESQQKHERRTALMEDLRKTGQI